MNFLHVHSTYSIGDSAQSPEDIVKRVSELGGRNVTLTDHRTLLGVDPFMEAGKKYGINTIPGVEGEVSLPDHFVRLLSNGDEKSLDVLWKARNHLLLIPFDYQGFQAISYAMKAANGNMKKVAQKNYPCLTDEMLKKHFQANNHVFATSACVQGPLAYILLLNFRLTSLIKRHEPELDVYLDDYESYASADMTERETKAKIKELSKERTAVSKPLKKPFQQKIDRLRKKMEQEPPESSKWIKAKSDLDIALSSVKKAEAEVSQLEFDIESLNKKKLVLAQIKAKTKKGYGKYVKAKEEISRLKDRLVDERILYQAAKMRLAELKAIFPKFFIELQYHGLESEAYVMPILLKLADETGTPIIAANDAHISDNSAESVEARRLIRFNFFMRSEQTQPSDKELYIKTDGELTAALEKVIPKERAQEAVRNTKILEECLVEFPNEDHHPKVRGGMSFDEAVALARQKRVDAGIWNDVYEQRLSHEVDVIKSMGYSDYHMVVEQFCRIGRLMGKVPLERRKEIYDHFEDLAEWVEKEQFDVGVGVGPGRGSAAGSLVCYLLGITNIDPIQYNLLFERFLNPERVSMPDIDTDIATSIRPILIAYLRWFYGEGAVCSIATTTTYGAKGAIKLAGRDRASQLFDTKNDEGADFLENAARKTGCDKWESAAEAGNIVKLKSLYQHENTYAIADMIPETPDITLEECEAEILPQLSADPEKMLLWNRAKLVEGAVSGSGVHAGGIILSDNDDVNEYVPLAWNEEKGVWVAQCDMVQVENKGLLKMDLLGLNTLDINNLCVALIERYCGIRVDLDQVPFEPAVFREIYASGNTNGVFQVESSGMKEMLKRFGPTCFEDIILLVAAFRPGPLQYLDDVIEVKNGRKKVHYKHPSLEPILSATYGATIYQEQVMQIFQTLAGYSLGGADLVRRAMSKKKMDKLALERKAFIYGDEERNIAGCVSKGISEETANEIFDELMEFAKYAFNKSHAAAYALVSYQTAWLKFHYPTEFLCALFECKKQEKFAPIIADCNLYHVSLLPPDINSSYYGFVIENRNIRYGFSGIKGIGEANKDVICHICDERKNGLFTGFRNFLKRTVRSDGEKYSLLPMELLNVLIDAGAFDALGYNRVGLKNALEEGENLSKKDDYDTLMDAIDQIDPGNMAKDTNYNLTKEVELLGTICSEQPLSAYGEDALYGCLEITALENGPVTVFGFVSGIESLSTKKGPMLKLQLFGKTGTCTVLISGASYAALNGDASRYYYKVVKIKGRCYNGVVYANQIEPMSAKVKKYTLRLNDYELQQKISRYSGGFHKDRQDGDDAMIMIWFYMNAQGQPLSPVKTRTIHQRWCSEEFVRMMVSQKIIKIGRNGELRKA